MNKLYLSTNEGAVLALILEPGNIHKLTTERAPIEIKLHEGPWKNGIPPKVTLNVFYSETPIADAKEIRKLLAKDGGEVKFEDTRTPVMETKRPHCPNCHSTIEQLGVWRGDAPVWLVFCVMCGSTLGAIPPVAGLEKAK
jgi:hypothetical protein